MLVRVAGPLGADPVARPPVPTGHLVSLGRHVTVVAQVYVESKTTQSVLATFMVAERAY